MKLRHRIRLASLRVRLAMLSHRIGCRLCSSGDYIHLPLSWDPGHHMRIPRIAKRRMHR